MKSCAPAETELLSFDDLAPYLLLQNGNFLYKVPFRGGWAVLKVYYGSRGSWGRIYKSIGNVLLYGQTSYMPRTRLRVERECLDLWTRHGFRTFQVYEGVQVDAPGCRPGGYLLIEYVDRPKLIGYLADESTPLEERLATWRRFLREWSRRHDVAIAEREPRLVHENGDGKHVMILENGSFLWFDFEMVYRSHSKVRRYVAHEIVQYVWQIARSLSPAMQERLVAETVRGYPVRERLQEAHDLFWRHPNPLMRLFRWIDRRRARRRKPTSKYAVARRLRAALDAEGTA